VASNLRSIGNGAAEISDPGRKIKIILADHNYMVRQGIKMLLESQLDFEVVGETDGNDVYKLALNLKPEVVVMDALLPISDPTIVIKRLINSETTRYVLVLGSHGTESQALRLLQAGAHGCIFKTASGENLSQAIRMIRGGQFVCDPSIEKMLLKYASQATSIHRDEEHLTSRESEVLRLAADGCSNREIANQLILTEGTVKSYFEHIFNKLSVRSRTEAVMEGLRLGLVKLDERSD
jgi:two-component system, NarL family, response regulator LiaR